jgi:hypothetical protein
MTHLAAAEPDVAARHAELCLSVCRANDAEASERFFAHEALARTRHACGDAPGALAARAVMADLVPDTDQGMRGYCESELAKLDALLGV